MRTLGVVAFVLASPLAVGTANAGDYSNRPFNWTGIYIGGSAGWGSQDMIVPPSPGRGTIPSPTGGFWGGQAGVNYQFASHWVVGAEIDGSLARMEDTVIEPDPLFPLSLTAFTVKLDSLVTARARLGYAWGRALIYATGGWAHSEVQVTSSSSNFGSPSGPRIVTDSAAVGGWTIGGGAEISLWSN